MASVREIFEQSRSILLSGHLRADGDCLGALSVLYHGFRALDRQVQILLPDAPDSRYRFLQRHTPMSIYQPGSALPEVDSWWVCDCSALSRLGPLQVDFLGAACPKVAVDHHPLEGEMAPQTIWDAMIHDVDAPASGQLALEFIESLGVELPLAAKEAAFLSLVSDTGWFRYPNATEPAWQAAARLVEGGVQPWRLFADIYQQTEAERPWGVAIALQHTRYLAEGRIAFTWVDRESLEQAGGHLEDTDEVLDLLRAVAQVEVVAFLFEWEPGKFKLSLRSKSDFDVSVVAGHLGGGGHRRAAGVRLPEGRSCAVFVAQIEAVLVQEWQRYVRLRG
ncbi:MAG: hypothetical protein DWQ01_13990 [Planctomycetota bacterium]|nr:MAG: hypothetical protein DWQ01_13990 [Planctomycetota bacterium]